MAKPIQIEYKGKTYNSIAQASRDLQCSAMFLSRVFTEAKGDEGYIEQKLREYKKGKKPIEIGGYRFESLTEAERETGISARVLKRMRERIKSDKEFSEWVEKEAEGFYALGNWYWSLKQASHELGVEEDDMRDIFQRYDYSQRKLDIQLEKLRTNSY